MSAYEPGQCNIGPREQRKRRLFGLASAIGGVAYAVAVVAVEWPPEALLASFVFAVGAAFGLMQARASFCAGFAMTERYDLSGVGEDETEATGDGGRAAGRVTNAAAVRQDRLRAGRLLVKAVLVAALVTAVVYLVGAALIADAGPVATLLEALQL